MAAPASSCPLSAAADLIRGVSFVARHANFRSLDKTDSLLLLSGFGDPPEIPHDRETTLKLTSCVGDDSDNKIIASSLFNRCVFRLCAQRICFTTFAAS